MVTQYAHWRGKSKEWYDLTSDRLAIVYMKLGWWLEEPKSMLEALDALDRLGYAPGSGLPSKFAFIEASIADGLLKQPTLMVPFRNPVHCKYAWGFESMLDLAVAGLVEQLRGLHSLQRDIASRGDVSNAIVSSGTMRGDLAAQQLGGQTIDDKQWETQKQMLKRLEEIRDKKGGIIVGA